MPKICPYCTHDIADEDRKFCPHCGEALEFELKLILESKKNMSEASYQPKKVNYLKETTKPKEEYTEYTNINKKKSKKNSISSIFLVIGCILCFLFIYFLFFS